MLAVCVWCCGKARCYTACVKVVSGSGWEDRVAIGWQMLEMMKREREKGKERESEEKKKYW
jgi:hypothetical protein